MFVLIINNTNASDGLVGVGSIALPQRVDARQVVGSIAYVAHLVVGHHSVNHKARNRLFLLENVVSRHSLQSLVG